jgi:Flp pilus assembly protein CpaB
MLAGIAIAILGGVLYSLHLKHYESRVQGGETIPIVVVIAQVREHAGLTRSVLGYKDVPRRFVEDRHVRANQIDLVLGVPSSRELQPGAWLNWDDVEGNIRESVTLAETLPVGQRAYTVEMESDSFGKMVAAGDRVDVLITAVRPNGTTRLTTVLLQNVLVLAIGQRRASRTGRTDHERAQMEEEERGATGRVHRQVTLSVNLDEATALFHALEFAERISLIVRNPSDESMVLTDVPVTTDLQLIEAQQRDEVQYTRPRRDERIRQIQ